MSPRPEILCAASNTRRPIVARSPRQATHLFPFARFAPFGFRRVTTLEILQSPLRGSARCALRQVGETHQAFLAAYRRAAPQRNVQDPRCTMPARTCTPVQLYVRPPIGFPNSRQAANGPKHVGAPHPRLRYLCRCSRLPKLLPFERKSNPFAALIGGTVVARVFNPCRDVRIALSRRLKKQSRQRHPRDRAR